MLSDSQVPECGSMELSVRRRSHLPLSESVRDLHVSDAALQPPDDHLVLKSLLLLLQLVAHNLEGILDRVHAGLDQLQLFSSSVHFQTDLVFGYRSKLGHL